MEVVEVNMDRVAMFWDIINDLYITSFLYSFSSLILSFQSPILSYRSYRLAMVCNHGNIHVRAHGAHAMAKIAESGLKDDVIALRTEKVSSEVSLGLREARAVLSDFHEDSSRIALRRCA